MDGQMAQFQNTQVFQFHIGSRMANEKSMTDGPVKCKRVAVIMAGGSGERFWPLSRVQRPKQLLNLLSADKSMIEEAIERISPLIPHHDIFIVTSELLQPILQEALPFLPAENIIAEPCKRNTAPCLALACSVVSARYRSTHTPESISMAVLTADHFIQSEEQFLRTVEDILVHAEQSNDLCTIGISPSRPETGYGYIEIGSEIRSNSTSVVEVKSFREKPSSESAMEFLRSGKFLWNSGMFFWRVSSLVREMIRVLPEVGISVEEMTRVLEAEEVNKAELATVFGKLPDVSIDFGVMEKSSHVAVARALFVWDDVGSWDSLKRFHQADSQGNVAVGKVVSLESHDTIAANYGTTNQIISMVGMENVIVVATDSAIMVCPADRAQDVKKIVVELRTRNQNEYL